MGLKTNPNQRQLRPYWGTCGNGILRHLSPPSLQAHSSTWDHFPYAVADVGKTVMALASMGKAPPHPFKNITVEPFMTTLNSGEKLVYLKPSQANSGTHRTVINIVTPNPSPSPELQPRPSHNGAFLKHRPLCGT